MLSDIQKELTKKFLTMKFWLYKLDDGNLYEIEKGLFFVYIYGIFEWLVKIITQRTIESINEYGGKIDEFIYDVYPLIFSQEIDSLQGCGIRKKWIAGAQISQRLKENNTVVIANEIFPTNGRNIHLPQLTSIATVFGIKEDVIPNKESEGYLSEVIKNRNYIAHGEKEPCEVGAGYSKKDIFTIYTVIYELSDFILQQYNNYIKNKNFLKKKCLNILI